MDVLFWETNKTQMQCNNSIPINCVVDYTCLWTGFSFFCVHINHKF